VSDKWALETVANRDKLPRIGATLFIGAQERAVGLIAVIPAGIDRDRVDAYSPDGPLAPQELCRRQRYAGEVKHTLRVPPDEARWVGDETLPTVAT
jgi:hypothetical protein